MIRIIDCITLEIRLNHFQVVCHTDCQIHLQPNSTEHIPYLEHNSLSVVKEFLAFYRTREFIGVFTKPLHWTVS
jgi:hypothetical protein